MSAAGKVGESADDPHVSIEATKRELGIARATVLSLIVRGDLTAERSAGRPVVTRKSLDAYKSAHGIGNSSNPVRARRVRGRS